VAQAFNPEDDPGWPRGLSALAYLIPGVLQRRARKPGTDALFALRQVMESFSAALVLFGVVLPFTNPQAGSPLPWFAVLAVMAVMSIVAARAVEKPLDCSSPTNLAGSYRTRFFLRLAFADTVALFGFTFAFLGGSIWIYYAGAVFTLIRFWTGIAPTEAALENDQRLLNERGCTLSLMAALRGGGPSAAN
jgi:F0F1-type ATP synthase membrane subunit c/vacuolar-type H+-ATPase subunit K